MKKKEQSVNGLNLLYSDFISQVNDYFWNNESDQELQEQLKNCVSPKLETAKLYSIVKEIIRRKMGLELFDSQIAAAYSMQCGRIAELPTGEGKTLAAVLTAACFALQGKRVHILVFNDYLARRDCLDNQSIFEFCGLSCGFIDENTKISQRKKNYAYTIVYLSAKEAGFDFLKDFLCTGAEDLVFPEFQVAIVDEADSILIDDARIPLVLAGDATSAQVDLANICEIVSKVESSDVEVNKPDNQVWLTETGITHMEKWLQTENLFAAQNTDILAMVNAALEARFLLEKDKDYLVKNNSIQVIDQSTGRVAEGRRFPDLLQHAIEAFEKESLHKQSMVYNSMSMQSFLLLYKTLCGMTGTAHSSANEIDTMYDLKVDVIPPHIPCIRVDSEDRIFLKTEDKTKAVLERVQLAHAKGQPILLCTQSVHESEFYSDLLTTQQIQHCVLNARNDETEAKIIEQAGEPYRVTVSTNMAGRGVDIKLGGANQAQAEFVTSVGGLLVISTGINRSLRIDNQLRGRAGRQGDPGESQFFISLEDSVVNISFDANLYNPKRFPKLVRRDQKIEEGKDAGARYMLEKYSDILEQQRKLITAYRLELLTDTRKPDIFQEIDPHTYEQFLLEVGERGVTLAEKQLTLYYINYHWANYLAAVEDIRSGIHLMIIGGKNPLDEYHRFSISAFDEMSEDIKSDVVQAMKKYKITDNGIDMKEAGLTGATTTWTYMLDESTNQFSRIPHLVKSVSNNIRGAVFTIQKLFGKIGKFGNK